MKRIIAIQFIVLFLGTAFAWFNFSREFLDWLAKRECETGCASDLVNPFLTPCFYGAIFFTAAFILSAVIFKKSRNN